MEHGDNRPEVAVTGEIAWFELVAAMFCLVRAPRVLAILRSPHGAMAVQCSTPLLKHYCPWHPAAIRLAPRGMSSIVSVG